MATKRTDAWVGLFVLAGIIALLFLALKVGNLASLTPTSETYRVTAKFDNIGGLKARAAVKSAGVVVGRVGTVGFDNVSYRAVLTLNLDKRYKFPKDTAAKILTSGILGEQYIGLDPGGDQDMLAGGDKIENTQSAVVLENLISQVLFNKAADAKGDDSSGAAPKPADAKAADAKAADAKPAAKGKP
jgi:phospholipid/cholesterol/gamma-HCH transport system substrate-binding protein